MITPQEQSVLDLWDRGYSKERIAKALPHLGFERVSQMLSRLIHTGADDRAWERGVRSASIALADACQRSGGRFA